MKVVCKYDHHWNLTQPYFHFRQGQVYECVNYDNDVFGFSFCDLLLTSEEFFDMFEKIEDFRNKKLEKLGI